jgi:hypothetical protein
VYEPGVSIDGSMPVYWMPGYEKKIAENRNLDALVEFTLADAPARLAKIPAWLMKWMLRLLFIRYAESKQLLGLLQQNLRGGGNRQTRGQKSDIRNTFTLYRNKRNAYIRLGGKSNAFSKLLVAISGTTK